MACKCCGRDKDLRFGVCFDCADAESAISEGLDMWDNPIPKQEGFSPSLAKLQYVLKKFKLSTDKDRDRKVAELEERLEEANKKGAIWAALLIGVCAVAILTIVMYVRTLVAN